MDRTLGVLVVDDSAYVRKMLKQMLSRSPFIEVVGAARNGREALELAAQTEPDVITSDLVMPEMDGVAFIREQMSIKPVPVIIVSIAGESGELALAALDAGAIDFLQKPTALATEKIFEMSDDLIEKVKSAAGVQMKPLVAQRAMAETGGVALKAKPGKRLVDIVLVGISTGGPQALKYLIPLLPADFPVPMVVVLHMPIGYTELYAKQLDALSSLHVVEAKHGDAVEPGTVLFAPAGRHLTFARRANGAVTVHLDLRPFDTLHRPSVDVTFQSAAEIFRSRTLGVVMTGMGSDGKQGAAWIKSQGGIVFTESDETCVIYGMPAAIVEAGLSDKSLPLYELANAIQEAV